MHLKKWKPHLSKGQYPGIYLSIKAILECPSCKHVNDYETEGHEIGGIKIGVGLEMLLSWKIDELERLKVCPKCGIVSCLPESDQKRLEKELVKMITEEWLKEAKIIFEKKQREKNFASLSKKS